MLDKKKLGLLRLIAAMSVVSFLLLFGMSALLFQGMARLSQTASQLEGAVEAVETMSVSLSQVDWLTLSASMEAAAGAASQGMEEALEVFAALDFEGLSQTVEELSAAVEPLANFARRFE